MDNATSPSLPLELIEEVVSHLHDDRTTLKALGLVSKALLSSTRAKLFSVTTFGQEGQKQFHTFLHLATAPWKSFSTHVKALRFEGTIWTFEASDVSLPPIERVIANLPNVHFIQLIDLNFRDIPPYIKDILARLTPRKLALNSVIFPTRSSLDDFLSWVPETIEAVTLRYLSCGNVDGLTAEFVASLEPRSTPFVHHRKLHFSDVDTQSMLLFHAYHGGLPGKWVDTFLVQAHDWMKVSSSMIPRELDLAEFMRKNGPSLQHAVFELHIPDLPVRDLIDPGFLFFNALDFSLSSKVRTAYIGMVEWMSDNVPRILIVEALATQFLDIVIQIPSLEQLTIDFRPPFGDPPRVGLSRINGRGESQFYQALGNLSRGPLTRICLRILVEKAEVDGYIREIKRGFLPLVGQGPFVAKVICLDDISESAGGESVCAFSKLLEPTKRVSLPGEDGWIEELDIDEAALSEHLADQSELYDLFQQLANKKGYTAITDDPDGRAAQIAFMMFSEHLVELSRRTGSTTKELLRLMTAG